MIGINKEQLKITSSRLLFYTPFQRGAGTQYVFTILSVMHSNLDYMVQMMDQIPRIKSEEWKGVACV